MPPHRRALQPAADGHEAATMASTDPNSDLGLGLASQPPLSNSEEDLRYDIMFERAILNSLAELPSDPDTKQKITDSKARIEKLQKQLDVVHRAQPQHPGTLQPFVALVTLPSLTTRQAIQLP